MRHRCPTPPPAHDSNLVWACECRAVWVSSDGRWRRETLRQQWRRMRYGFSTASRRAPWIVASFSKRRGRWEATVDCAVCGWSVTVPVARADVSSSRFPTCTARHLDTHPDPGPPGSWANPLLNPTVWADGIIPVAALTHPAPFRPPSPC